MSTSASEPVFRPVRSGGTVAGSADLVVGTVVVVAWLTMIIGGGVGWGRLLDHDYVLATLPPPGGRVALFLVAWCAMVAAMMLPGALPAMRRATRHANERTGAMLAGYLALWMFLGLCLLVGDGTLHAAVADNAGLRSSAEAVVPIVVLAVAGLCQLRRAWADEDRPTGSLRTAGSPFVVGAAVGVGCARCCGPLMVVMMAASAHSLPAMAAATAVMTYQQVGRRRRAASLALGGVAVIIAVSAVVARLSL